MLNKLLVLTAAIAVTLLMPSTVDAYGAAHVGYTHVGPSGVQHYGATEVRSPYGSAGGAHYGYAAPNTGSTYKPGYNIPPSGSGGAYHYSGNTAGGAYHYNYVR